MWDLSKYTDGEVDEEAKAMEKAECHLCSTECYKEDMIWDSYYKKYICKDCEDEDKRRLP